jgi:threonine dehydratase
MTARALAFDDVAAAARRIGPHVRRTPLVRSDYLSDATAGEVYLKLEAWQMLGAFKIRGMINRALTLTAEQLSRGVVVASSGNHGVAAGWCGRRFGFLVDAFVPGAIPAPKLAKLRRYGARVHLCGTEYDDAYLAAKAHVSKPGSGVWVDPCCDPAVLAGHGTIGIEVASELAGLDEILVPVGGGGLITGVGVALRELLPAAKVTGVQTRACPAMLAAMRDGRFYETYPSGPSICDALIGGVGEVGWQMASRCIDRVVLADELDIACAVAGMLREEQVLAEPAGAVGWAYVAAHPDGFRGRRVVVVVTGANIDYSLLRRLVAGAQGEAGSGHG